MADNDALEYAKAANSIAQEAAAHAIASGIILDALISVLLNGGSISKDELRSAFLAAREHIKKTSATLPSDAPGRLALVVVKAVAAGHGVDLKDDEKI